MKPLVSILIPAYNAREWIGHTLKSAIAQTWDRKEIIVVDDGSRDDTYEIAKTFSSHNVLVVRQENQGAAAARNRALELSQGAYIQWLDADDLLSVNKIAKQVEEGQRSSIRTLLSSAWGWFMYRPSRVQFVPTLLWCDLPPSEWLIRKMANNLHMQTATWLVSRELTDSAGAWDTTLSVDDDGEYFCRVLLQSDGVKFIREASVLYRLSGASSVSYIGRSKKKIEDQFRSMQLHIGYLRSLEDSERVHVACIKYLQTWHGYFYPERMDIVKQAEQIAADLGGRLVTPQLSWKYTWIRKLFGWSLAKQAQVLMPSIKWSLRRKIDKLLFMLEKRNSDDAALVPPSGLH
jgi:glycosyltransferase involved in cell wall biosynthesis